MFNELLSAINIYKSAAQKQYSIHAETMAKIENTYAPAVAKKLKVEENKNFAKSLEEPRKAAKAVLSQQIGKAKRYINHQLNNIDKQAIDEIHSLHGLPFGAADILALKQKYNGSYWSTKALNSILNEMLPPTSQIPDISPDFTLAVLDKMENELNFVIDYYDGRELLESSMESIACERIMSGISLGEYAADLNKNELFSESRIEDFYKPLTPEEDKDLYGTFFKDCDTDFEKSQKVKEMIGYGLGEKIERSIRFSKYLPEDYEHVTGVSLDE